VTEEKDGWLVAECPSLPGVVTQGKTQEELFDNLREAIALWLETRDELALANNPAGTNVHDQELRLSFA
jgi:predicted RNase H-like HicB family nuclease